MSIPDAAEDVLAQTDEFNREVSSHPISQWRGTPHDSV